MTQPTAEFRQHHSVDSPRVDRVSFRQGWRVATRLDVLYRDGRISAGEFQAAVEYRTAWERVTRAHLVTSKLEPAGDARGGDRLAPVVDTITRLRTVEAEIGALAASLCVACLVDDRPWVVIARSMHRDRETVRNWTVAAIRHLAAAW